MGMLESLKNLLNKDTAPNTRASAPPPAAPTLEPITIVEVTSTTLAAELEQGAPVRVIDVRMPWDYAAMHMPGAVSIPLNSLPANLDKLAPSDNLVLVCYHGISSQDGAAFLLEQGYTTVRSMRGGFTQWAAEGRPTEK
jgi:rhodanese-related sulfurtransferase